MGRIAFADGLHNLNHGGSKEGYGYQQSQSSQPTWIRQSRNLGGKDLDGWLELLDSNKIASLR